MDVNLGNGDGDGGGDGDGDGDGDGGCMSGRYENEKIYIHTFTYPPIFDPESSI